MPKLPRGMFKRGRAYYVRRREAGRDRWHCLGEDYQVACRKLRELRAGHLPPAVKVTVSAAATTWLDGYVRTARNEKGVKLATRRVELYLSPFFGYRWVGQVTAEDLRQYRLWLEGQGLVPQTVAHVLSDARCFFTWCSDSGLMSRSPVPRRLLPRIQECPPDRLSADEIEAVSHVREPYGFMVRLALGTGLRWSELCRTQASHVERGMLVVAQTKSGKVRRVPLSPELLGEIRGRVGRLVPYSVLASGSFARIIQQESGVSQFHPHQLRHTFACMWLERGGSLAALQQVLGHSTIITTQRYARLTDEIVRAEAERMAQG